MRRARASGGKQRQPGEIRAVAVHGQTIRHRPHADPPFTWQIGDAARLAKATGIDVAWDFRTADVAVGGSGAPLVPLFDYLTLRSDRVSRAVVNIGGIANITVLPRRCRIEEVSAFDTGPGNMVIDALMARYYDRPFDRGGAVARRGRILPAAIRAMLAHPYFSQRPPKSTGREAFGAAFVSALVRAGRGAPPEDLVATATEFTALSIYQQYLAFVHKRTPIDELLVCGGGVKNDALMEALRSYFDRIPVRPTQSAGVSPEAKEAVCFALLARETVLGRPGNIPGATGAARRTVLGTIALPE